MALTGCSSDLFLLLCPTVIIGEDFLNNLSRGLKIVSLARKEGSFSKHKRPLYENKLHKTVPSKAMLSHIEHVCDCLWSIYILYDSLEKSQDNSC